MKKILAVILSGFALCLSAQSSPDKHMLDLKEAISIATDSSLTAFRAKNMYLSSYWKYRTFKAENLPQLSLSSTPIRYNQNFMLRYNSETNIDEYRSQQSINSSLGLRLVQNVNFLGGTISVNTDLAYLKTFSAGNIEQFSATPVSIGYDQPLFGYNQMRWNKRIEPLRFEAAKRNLLYSIQEVAEDVTRLYFTLVMAQTEYTTAVSNSENADSLYKIGIKKYDIASISKGDLLTLNLDAINARNTLTNARIELKRSEFDFISYLRLPKDSRVELIIPELPVDFDIDSDQALEYAKNNNPRIIEFIQKELEAQSQVQRMKIESRFSANLRASVGFNQAGDTFTGAYKDLRRQDLVLISFTVPILDWGIAKGKYNMAKSNYDVVRISNEKDEVALWQDVQMTVSDFNIQQELIKTALAAKEIAQQAYQSVVQRFIIGQTDVNSMTLALDRQNRAQTNYINTLKNYWLSYAKIKKLTLYDFEKKTSLSEEFDYIYKL